MNKYQKISNDLGNEFIVRSNDDETTTWIPIDESNSDYQQYLKDIEEGN